MKKEHTHQQQQKSAHGTYKFECVRVKKEMRKKTQTARRRRRHSLNTHAFWYRGGPA